MDKTPAPPATKRRLPEFPDEGTPAQWIWPPLAGRDMLDKVLKYALRARLQSDGTWMINAKNDWRCYSKSYWLYENVDLAREALRANMRAHLLCIPILPKQRCVAVVCDAKNTWRLWQICHNEPTLAENLAKALGRGRIDELVLETFRCATQYADALQQCIQYPPLLDLTLANIGIDAKRRLVYLGCVDEQAPNTIQLTSEETLIDTIQSAFAALIAETLPPQIDVGAVVKEFEGVDGFEQQPIVDMLTQLFRDVKNGESGSKNI